MNHEITVAAGAASKRLDVYLGEELSLSRSQIQRLVKAGFVTVNGQPERVSYTVTPGDRIKMTVTEAPVEHLPPPTLTVVYEDEDVVVVEKPAGVAVHGGAGLRRESTIADYARTISSDPDLERPGIVHRLDRETSGLLVIAKNVAAKEFLQAQWRSKSVAKRYELLAVGRITPTEAVINMALERDPAHPLRRHVSHGGKPAVTRYKLLADTPGYSYIEARPETGRTHQLRVHFAALGHAIAGDVVYGPTVRPLGLKRHFLHATALRFTAPNGNVVDLRSPLPKELADVLKRLEEGLY